MSSSPVSGAVRPTLILAHGATLNGRMWDPVRRHLDDRYDVVAPDLPGHGSRSDGPYTLEGAAETLAAAARAVAPAPVILVGDSLGAYSSMAAAGVIPSRQLKGLVLGGSTFQFVGASVFPYVFKGAVFKLLAAVFGDQRISEALMPKALTKEFGLDPADARALIDARIRSSSFGDAVRALRGVDFRAMLGAIVQPVLLVNGDQDTVNVRDEASFLDVAIDASVRRLDCKHGVSLLRIPEFATLVNEFAGRVFAQPAVRTDAAAG